MALLSVSPLTRIYPSKAGDPWPALFLIAATAASVIILSVLAVIVWLSFRTGGVGDPASAYSLSNYLTTFLDPFTYRVLVNTFYFAFVTLVVALAFGLPAAWLVERTDLPGKSVLFTFMAIGLSIPGFATAMGWLFLLHPRIGLLNVWLQQSFGFAAAPLNVATVMGMGWVQGLRSGAGRLHHDRRCISLGRSGARGSGANVGRDFRPGSANRDNPTGLAWGSRRSNLHFHHRLLRLRRTGDHRLGQSDLHFLELPRPPTQPE